MFKTLILQANHNLSDERTEYLIRDRLSFMRFLGLGLADTVPDANTIWTFREALRRAKIAGQPAIEVVFERFDAALAAAGFPAMSGQIIDASIVAAPKQRNTGGEKRDIKEGRIPAAWAGQPAKLRQKDRDARWTVKHTKAKPSADGAPRVDLRLTAAIAAELDAARQHSEHTGRPARRFKDSTWSTLDSWSRSRRVIGKAEWTGGAANPRVGRPALPPYARPAPATGGRQSSEQSDRSAQWLGRSPPTAKHRHPK